MFIGHSKLSKQILSSMFSSRYLSDHIIIIIIWSDGTAARGPSQGTICGGGRAAAPKPVFNFVKKIFPYSLSMLNSVKINFTSFFQSNFHWHGGKLDQQSNIGVIKIFLTLKIMKGIPESKDFSKMKAFVAASPLPLSQSRLLSFVRLSASSVRLL